MSTLAVGVLLAAATTATQSPQGLESTWRALTARNPQCPLPNALNAGLHAKLLNDTKNRILSGSRLLERDPEGFEHWATPLGRYWIPKGTQYTLPFNLAEEAMGIYRTREIDVRPGDIVLDCGANVGVFVTTALKAGARTVVAIEPLEENLTCLRRNFADEIADGRVIVCPVGVWNIETTLTLRVEPENTAAASFVMGSDDWGQVLEIPVTTIDLLVDELGLPRVDFIKMDIEGSECKAIKGARATLSAYRPRLAISSYHMPDDPEEIPLTVQSAVTDYRVHCGPCTDNQEHVRPDVLLFEAPPRM